jgi:hypothetical protein
MSVSSYDRLRCPLKEARARQGTSPTGGTILTSLTRFLPAMLAATLLGGCAASAQTASTHVRTGPDCSFRSATTCWTVAARFPAARSETGDSIAKELRRPTPRTLASRADSSQGVR